MSCLTAIAEPGEIAHIEEPRKTRHRRQRLNTLLWAVVSLLRPVRLLRQSRHTPRYTLEIDNPSLPDSAAKMEGPTPQVTDEEKADVMDAVASPVTASHAHPYTGQETVIDVQHTEPAETEPADEVVVVIENDNAEHDANKPASDARPLDCFFCWKRIEDEPLKTCWRCENPCCNECVRTLFLNALKNENDMPPRCCKFIPLAYGRLVLSDEEVALYKEKYEEYNTTNRSYCPVPTCSAFIPLRRFVTTGGTETNSDGTPGIRTFTASCPKCATVMCGICKQLAHPGRECHEDDDVDSELADLMRRWGYKRCPKCRTAIRRMHGCSHMQCRCGAQWCWHCTGPIQRCRDRGCPREQESEDFDWAINTQESERRDREYRRRINAEEGPTTTGESEADGCEAHERQQPTDAEHSREASDEPEGAEREAQECQGHVDTEQAPASSEEPEANPDTKAVATTPRPEPLINLDAGWDWESADENFGAEPNGSRADQFNCKHRFEVVDDTAWDPKLYFECERCWRRIYPQSTAQDETHEAKSNLMSSCDHCDALVCPDCRKREEDKQAENVDDDELEKEDEEEEE